MKKRSRYSNRRRNLVQHARLSSTLQMGQSDATNPIEQQIIAKQKAQAAADEMRQRLSVLAPERDKLSVSR